MRFSSRPQSNAVQILICIALVLQCFFDDARAQSLVAYNSSEKHLSFAKAGAATNTDVECRDPKPDESAAVNKARQVIDKCIGGGLQRMGWQAQNSDQVNVSIATHPNPFRPMFICSRAFDMTIGPDPNSAYGKMVSDSIQYYQTQTSRAAILRMTLLMNLQNIKIRITENQPYLKSRYDHNDDDKYSVLHIPGVAYAYRLTEPEQGAGADIPPDYKTFILIGNWPGANMNFNTYVNYPFIHKTAGAYIETLTVQILGPAAIADKLIHNVDWQGLSAALTK